MARLNRGLAAWVQQMLLPMANKQRALGLMPPIKRLLGLALKRPSRLRLLPVLPHSQQQVLQPNKRLRLVLRLKPVRKPSLFLRRWRLTRIALQLPVVN